MTTAQVTTYRDGVQYTVHIEVDMQRVGDELVERASRNKSKRSIACKGGVRVKIIAEVPTR